MMPCFIYLIINLITGFFWCHPAFFLIGERFLVIKKQAGQEDLGFEGFCRRLKFENKI